MSKVSTSEKMRVGIGTYELPFQENVDRQNRYIQWASRKAFQVAPDHVAAITVPEKMYAPSVVAAWLPAVEKRITDSILPEEYWELETCEWLGERVGNAALNFFRNNSDLLPGEPYIYASRSGNVVAEFEAPHGTMTAVISRDTAVVFADANGAVYEATFGRGSNSIREELKGFTQILCAGTDGPVETA